MNFSRVIYIACLSLSSFSMSVYADDMLTQEPTNSQLKSGQQGVKGSQQQNQIQPPTQVNDDGGNLKAAPSGDKKGQHSYSPQSSNDQQGNNTQESENTPPAMDVTQTEANNFDSV